MEIRSAKQDDETSITELYYKLYPERKSGRLIPIDKSEIKSIILIAEEDKKPVGFIWAHHIRYGISRFGYIEELFVDGKFRKKGIGTMLVKETLKRFDEIGVQAVFVTTETENEVGAEFYKKLGFKTCAPWFVWTPENK